VQYKQGNGKLCKNFEVQYVIAINGTIIEWFMVTSEVITLAVTLLTNKTLMPFVRHYKHKGRGSATWFCYCN